MDKLNELVEMAKASDGKWFATAINPESILAIAEAFRELERRAEAAEAKLAELAKQEPVGYYRRGKDKGFYLSTIDAPRPGCVPLFTRPAPAAVPVDLVPDESGLADRHIAWLNTLQRSMFSDEDWEELSLYTWLAFRDSFRVHHAEMLRRIEGLK